MRYSRQFTTLAILFSNASMFAADAPSVKETVVSAPLNVAIKIRMDGPYTEDTPLQVVC